MSRWQDGVGIGAILRQRSLRTVLAGLLAVDLVLVALHGAHLWSLWQRSASGFAAPSFSLEMEGSLGEQWEVLKGALSAAVLADAARRSGQPLYAALAFGFGLATLDNLLELHERGGAWIAGVLAGARGVSAGAQATGAQAIGELAAFLMEGLLIAGVLLLGFRRSRRTHWPAGAIAALLLAGLAAFGIGVDALHAALADQRWSVNALVGTIEDGGELVMLTLAAAYAVGLRQQVPRRDEARLARADEGGAP